MRPFSVLIPDAENPHAHDVVHSLAAGKRVAIHLLFAKKDRRLKHSRHVASVGILEKYSSDEEWLPQMLAAIRRLKPDVILPINEPAIRRCSKYASQLSSVCSLAPLPTPEQFDLAVDKESLATIMAESGIPCPATLSESELLSSPSPQEQLPLPWILKMCRGAYGHGMMKISSEKNIARGLNLVRKAKRRYIAQEFIEGEDIGCTVLCTDGRVGAYTMHRGVKPASTPFRPPLAIEFIHDERVLDVVRDLMRALQWNGIAHIDLRRKRFSGEPYILELNGRFEYSTLGSLTAGVNFPLLSCLAALGAESPVPSYRAGTYLVNQIPRIAIRRGRISWKWRWSRWPFVLGDPVPYALRKLRHQHG